MYKYIYFPPCFNSFPPCPPLFLPFFFYGNNDTMVTMNKNKLHLFCTSVNLWCDNKADSHSSGLVFIELTSCLFLSRNERSVGGLPIDPHYIHHWCVRLCVDDWGVFIISIQADISIIVSTKTMMKDVRRLHYFTDENKIK